MADVDQVLWSILALNGLSVLASLQQEVHMLCIGAHARPITNLWFEATWVLQHVVGVEHMSRPQTKVPSLLLLLLGLMYDMAGHLLAHTYFLSDSLLSWT